MKTKTMNKPNPSIIYCLRVIPIVIIVIIIIMGAKSCVTGKNPKDYKSICIEGHVYHTISFSDKTSLAIKLDDEGRPVKCP